MRTIESSVMCGIAAARFLAKMRRHVVRSRCTTALRRRRLQDGRLILIQTSEWELRKEKRVV
jgi:hypothetical protein